MKLLVTGGLGFVGTNFAVDVLARPGVTLRVLDNGSAGPAQPPLHHPQVEVVIADVRDAVAVCAACRGVDAVLHLAAQTGVVESLEDPLVSVAINVDGTVNVLEAARQAGVRRVVVASSNAAVGAHEPPLHEEAPARPVSPYGATKLAGEALCSAWQHAYGMRTVALRFSNLYGPWSVHKGSVVASFFRAALAGRPLVVHGDGTQTRDMLYTGDLNRALMTALTHPAAAGVYQVGSGVETAIGDLARQVAALVARSGIAVRVESAPARAGDVARNYSSVERLASQLGFRPEVGLEEGLRQTWAWFQAQAEGEGARWVRATTTS